MFKKTKQTWVCFFAKGVWGDSFCFLTRFNNYSMKIFNHDTLAEMLDLTFNRNAMMKKTDTKGPVYPIKRKKRSATNNIAKAF